ncbi:MAG: phosphoribosylamine--glycine ligase [Flavobacteriales bacterium]|nr:phosphoribosylamine--glycine ligase [Flavobacteriales bacterium]
MKKLRVLLLGGGGREHAIAWKIAQSELLDELFVAPGNGGTQAVATNLGFGDSDFEAMKQALLDHDIDLVVVGPEAPLVKGIREFIEGDAAIAHVKIVGPGKIGAQLEGSKSFSKQFMQRQGIPTARFGEFDAAQLADAKAFLDGFNPPYVLKADGLAAGKGVLIIDDKEEAKRELDEMLVGGKFGDAGARVVIEEFLAGIELSVFALTDGTDYVLLPEAKDYKRIGEGDVGLNTGGMGSISPVPFAKGAFMEKVITKIVDPTIQGLKKEGIDYNGFLFVGLMNVDGEPFVIEYNCRMGDPETESVVPRIKSDLLSVLWKCGNAALAGEELIVDERTATCVMAVSGGYPEAYEKGKEIEGLSQVSDSLVFHAGTKERDGSIVSSGGRVIAFTSFGNTMAEALEKSYQSLSKVHFDKMYYRKDIGFDLVGSKD